MKLKKEGGKEASSFSFFFCHKHINVDRKISRAVDFA